MTVQPHLLIAALTSVLATSCGPLADAVTSSTSSSNASVRIVHGSPDAGNLDVKLDSAIGTALITSAAYGAVGSYVSVTAGSHNVALLPAGGTTASLTCTSPSLSAGTKYTIVVVGVAAKGYGTTLGVQCQVFAEATFSTPSGDYTLAVHHASPAANAAGYGVLSFGPFSPGSGAYQSPAGSAAFTAPISYSTATGTIVTDVAIGVADAPGVGFWFAPQTSTAPTSILTAIRPSQGVAGAAGVNGSSDSGDLLPYNSSLINFSVYVVDGQNGAAVHAIGAFD